MIDKPSDREIIWICGHKGKEGKSFLQTYIKQTYGTRCVVKTELNARKADLAFILAHTSLTCKDMFLFNLLRLDNDVAYGLLENLNDGHLVSSKYKATEVKIKVPNVVIVFSNELPIRNNCNKT